MRNLTTGCVVAFLVLAFGTAHAQLIIEDFDSQTTGSPPAWLWWNNGSSGTILVDDSTFLGSSGKSVEIARTTFDGRPLSFGRNFPPIDGPAELAYYFRVGSTSDEVLTAVGGNNSGHQVAWWVGVGGAVGNAIGTYSESGGWNSMMTVAADTWYRVKLEINPAAFTYDITVWEDGNPGNTAKETDIPFRDGSEVEVIDQIQFGNFSDAETGPTTSAYVDEVEFVGARVLDDNFESGNTGFWSSSTRPMTAVTTCYQTVITDAYLANNLICDTGDPESVGVELSASNIYFDLNGHTISGHPAGIGVRAMNLEGVTVKNGWIQNFGFGLDIVNTVRATVKDVYVSELILDDPNEFRMGMRINRSQQVMIRDSFFEFLPVAHKEAIVSATSEILVDNIEVKNASVGLNISSDGNPEGEGTNATVVNSRFVGVTIGGILVQWTDDTYAADNEFNHTETALGVDTHKVGGTTGIVFEHNFINRSYIAVHLMGTDGASILDNVIRNGRGGVRHGWRGIWADSIMGCPETGTAPGCFHATDNLIAGNEAAGSIFDLHHHELATPNTWTNNTCETKEGADIPPCIAPGP